MRSAEEMDQAPQLSSLSHLCPCHVVLVTSLSLSNIFTCYYIPVLVIVVLITSLPLSCHHCHIYILVKYFYLSHSCPCHVIHVTSLSLSHIFTCHIPVLVTVVLVTSCLIITITVLTLQADVELRETILKVIFENNDNSRNLQSLVLNLSL